MYALPWTHYSDSLRKMYRSLQSLAGRKAELAFVEWYSHGSRAEVVPLTSLEEMRQVYFWSSTCSFPVARTVLSHLIADQYIHCCHPSHHFKTGQAVGVWWINHERSAIGSLRHWNLPNWVVGRTANNKCSVTCGLTSSHFWGLLFLISKPKICMFTLINPLDSWTFSLLFSLPTHMDRDGGREAKSIVISETLWKYCACKRTIWNLSKHSKSGF